MTNLTNRDIVASAMDALSKGDGSLFVGAMADDFTWHMRGTTPWSGTYTGKPAVRAMFARLFDQFATQYRNHPRRIFSDQDFVIVECKGDVMTKRGVAYDNDYCYVIRMQDGKMAELTEYFDTALVEAALDPPGAA